MARRRDDEEDYEDDRPQRKRRKSVGGDSTKILLIVLGVGFGMMIFCCVPGMIALLLPAVQQAREAARRTEDKRQLMQVGLAAHNFHDVHQHFPPAGSAADGSVPQSWLTDLLPYVDQAALYNSINRKAAWNDPSNQGPMSARVPAYLNPTLKDWIDPATGYGLAHLAGNQHVFGRDKPLAIKDFTDGTTVTMLAGSVATGLKPWGDPANLRDPAAGVGTGPGQFLRHQHQPRGAHVLMADGSVRYVGEDASPNVMTGLAKPDDGVAPQEF